MVSTAVHLVPLAHRVVQHHYLDLVDMDALVLLNRLEAALDLLIRSDYLIVVSVDQMLMTIQTLQDVESLLSVSKREVAQEVHRSIGRNLCIVCLDHQLVHFLNILAEPSIRAELLDVTMPVMII